MPRCGFEEEDDKLKHARPNIIRLLSVAQDVIGAALIIACIAASAASAAQGVQKQHSLDHSHASININQASAQDFEKLPGIGPEIARRIVAYRDKHGPFRRVEDLLVIRGIGPRKWKAIRPYLRIDSKATK